MTKMPWQWPPPPPSVRYAMRPVKPGTTSGEVAAREATLAVVPPDPAAEIRAVELRRSRLQRQREDLAAGEGRYRDHPVAHAIWELHQAEVNVASLERNLTGSRSSRAQRRTWRSEFADWRSNHATASRALEVPSARSRRHRRRGTTIGRAPVRSVGAA